MSIFVDTLPVKPGPIVEQLRRLAPDEPVFTDAADVDPRRIEMLMSWRLRQGAVERFPRLRLLACVAAGVDKLLRSPALPPALPVVRTVDPAQNEQIAQYVTAMALRHLRELPRYEAQQAARAWTRHPAVPAGSRTVGVLGLGETGRVSVRMLRDVGFRVVGWRRTAAELSGITTFHGDQGLRDCLAASDCLVCLLPLTDETRGLLDHARLGWLPRGAYLINAARGEHLVEADLLRRLQEGHLSGAALDVQAQEPLPADSPLWSDPRITVTPHIASDPTVEAVARQALENLRRARAGEPLLSQVDRARGY